MKWKGDGPIVNRLIVRLLFDTQEIDPSWIKREDVLAKRKVHRHRMFMDLSCDKEFYTLVKRAAAEELEVRLMNLRWRGTIQQLYMDTNESAYM